MSDPIPDIGFTQSAGVTLAYQYFGSGPPLLFVNGFVSHLECLWEEPGLAQFFRCMAEQFQIILFDKRGVGLSERLNTIPTLDDTVEDMQSLLNTLGIDQACVFGVSEGGPAALMFAATYPQRVSKLLLYGTMPKWIRSYDYPWALSRTQYDKWLESMVAGWGGVVSLQSFAPSQMADAQFCAWWAKALRQSASPSSLREILQAMREIDVRDCLAYVQAPTLILHKALDPAVPVEGARFLAKQLAQAELHEFAGIDHWWWTEPYDALMAALADFMSNTTAEAESVATQPSGGQDRLSQRELEILQLIATGYSNQSIADTLFLSLGTIKTYTSSIYAKLQVKNRNQAIIAGRKRGLLQ